VLKQVRILEEVGMHSWSEGDVVAHGTRLHYYRTGGKKPSIVLVHGITDDGLCWTPVAEALSGGYDVIMVDLRGHGKSEAPEGGYDLATMATELAGLITGLGLESPVVWGHSLGGVTALTLASLDPDLPRAIILEDPPAFWNMRPASAGDPDVRAEMLSWITGVKRKTRDELLAHVRTENPSWPEVELGPWADSKHRFSLKIAQILDSRQAIPADYSALLSRITCPVLLISADPEKGAAASNEDIASLRESVPHLERVKIPDAGHNIRREQFSHYMSAVQSYLASLVR
jgi:pimeloyl-ACP methyl ester carboxylesterase